MIKTVFSITKLIKMKGKIKKFFQCNLKMKVVAEDLHLNLYNNTENVTEICQVKNKFLTAYCKEKLMWEKVVFPRKTKKIEVSIIA